MNELESAKDYLRNSTDCPFPAERLQILFIICIVGCVSMFSSIALCEEYSRDYWGLSVSGIVQAYAPTEHSLISPLSYGAVIQYQRQVRNSPLGFGGGVYGAMNTRNIGLGGYFLGMFELYNNRHRVLVGGGPEFGFYSLLSPRKQYWYPNHGVGGSSLLVRASISWMSPWHITASASYSFGSPVERTEFIGITTLAMGVVF
jgi:hypothetical protein